MPINPNEARDKIERLGSYIDHYEQREKLLRQGIGANVDRKADYAVMSGCNPLFSLTPVKSFVDLLRYFDVSYTFLSREVCCGRPVAEGMFYEKTDSRQKSGYDDFIRRSLETNINRAKELGAKTLVNICPGCNMTWNIYGRGLGLDIKYYTDFLSDIITEARLEKNIDYYEGCHKLHKVEPESLRLSEGSNHELLSRIKGLSYRVISDGLCCRISADKILSRVKTGTLVTPSQCCYSNLKAAITNGKPEVKFLAEVVGEAVRGDKNT